MNAAIRSVVRSCSHFNLECSGVYRGYQGLIEGDIRPLNPRSVNNIINKGGTKLKSARSLDFHDKKGRQKAYENLKQHNVDALIVIGGDGSFTGGMIFEQEHKIPVIGVPGTIDNDIYGTSHTIGFDTALNTVVEAIDKIRDTAISHNRLFFVETHATCQNPIKTRWCTTTLNMTQYRNSNLIVRHILFYVFCKFKYIFTNLVTLCNDDDA